MNSLPDSVNTDKAINEFLQAWTIDSAHTKDFFAECYALIKSLPHANYEFIARPTISYSLRASIGKNTRPLFVLVDIIDDDPHSRWLSICFYADSLKDPDSIADLVPNGLFGEDAMCFDVDNADSQLNSYLLTRVNEAYTNSDL